MTLQEFKAWFDGFTENVGDKGPTLKQWKRIKDRVGEIDGVAITYPVYIDRWLAPYRPYYPYWYSTGGTEVSSVSGISFSNSCQTSANTITTDTVKLSFNSNEAMFAAGQAEAASMN